MEGGGREGIDTSLCIQWCIRVKQPSKNMLSITLIGFSPLKEAKKIIMAVSFTVIKEPAPNKRHPWM